MATVRVGVAQLALAPGDVEANLDAHLAAVAKARGAGVELLLFPELSLTGYESHPDTAHLARRRDGPELGRLAQAGDGITVALGFIEAAEPGRPFNSCAVLAGGRVRHVHRKLNLPTYGGLVEGEHYGRGAGLGLVATPLGPAACLVCADTWNPVLPWLAALSGAEAVLVPVASARGAVAADFDSREGWRLNLRHTAMTYGVPVLMANGCGRAGGLAFWGGSTIVDASGRVVAEAGDAPELLVADLDPDDGARARRRLPTIRDADPHLVEALLASLLREDREPSTGPP